MGIEDVPSQNANGAAKDFSFVVERKSSDATKLLHTLKETPVEAYEDAPEVPSEFLVKDPTKMPTRRWGTVDAQGEIEFPVIELSPLMMGGDKEAAKRVITEIGRACEEWGFFQVVNRGMSESLLDNVIDVTNEFFQLPLEEKQQYAVKAGETEGYGRLDFNLAGLGAARTRFWNDVMRHNIRPTRTIEEDRMPNKPESYRPLIEEYTRGMEAVLDVVWTSLSEHLGLEPTKLRKAQDEDSILIVRLNYYPKCAEPEKVLGCGAHKDFGSLTVLLQDEVGGLQVQKPGSTDNKWLDVKPMKGALLIHVANQVEILSNGRYHSVLHRALVNQNSARLSIASFASPGPKVVIAPLQEVLEKTQQVPRYKQLLYGDYAANFAADVKAGKSPHARYELNRH